MSIDKMNAVRKNLNEELARIEKISSIHIAMNLFSKFIDLQWISEFDLFDDGDSYPVYFDANDRPHLVVVSVNAGPNTYTIGPCLRPA